VLHINNYDAWQLWLGCFGEGYDQVTGADGEYACPPTGCTDTAFGSMTFDQDECFGDGSDAGLTSIPDLRVCRPATIAFSLVRCVGERVYLNVLIDMNGDGDWNDSFACGPDGGACAFEWAIKNHELPLQELCGTFTSPEFTVGPHAGPAWMRITVSTNPAADSYPWSGESLFYERTVDFFYGGETEDYPVAIADVPTTTSRTSWGRLKVRYR
jgi:hypothetical protein